jgi:hypothetical protein
MLTQNFINFIDVISSFAKSFYWCIVVIEPIFNSASMSNIPALSLEIFDTGIR